MRTDLGRLGIEGVAFDAVGTLIEPFPSVARAYADAAARQGVEVDVSEVKRRFHQYFRVDEVDEIRGPMATDEAIERRRWRRIVGNVLPDLPDVEHAFAELWNHFGTASAWRVFEDVPETIATLRLAGIPFVIASNFDGRLREVILGLPDLADQVDSTVISSEVGFRKPHPAFYRAVCEALRMPADQILFIGDDLENDVTGPIRAGLGGVRLDRDGRSSSTGPAFSGLTSILDRYLASRMHGLSRR